MRSEKHSNIKACGGGAIESLVCMARIYMWPHTFMLDQCKITGVSELRP